MADHMDEQTMNFWQHHSLHYLEMALRSDRRERLTHPDGYGKKTGDCGDTIEFFLMTDNGTLSSIAMETDGCVDTVACANTVAELAEGKNLEDAWEIVTPDAVAAYLETLAPSKVHCAELAVGAFYLALANAGETERNPGKKRHPAQ
ncbi:MAG: iron-sulfur cluster assembly scaffold protein [Syntrophobacteraceae bacterium]